MVLTLALLILPGTYHRIAEDGHASGRVQALTDKVATIADGLGAPFVGDHCFPIVRDHVEKVVVLPDAAIVEAMKVLLSRCKLMAEGAGAASVAALLSDAIPLPQGARVCCVISGGNVDLSRLKDLI